MCPASCVAFAHYIVLYYFSLQALAELQTPSVQHGIETKTWTGHVRLARFVWCPAYFFKRLFMIKMQCTCMGLRAMASSSCGWTLTRHGGKRVTVYYSRASTDTEEKLKLTCLKVPVVTPAAWLHGTCWEGIPYHVTLGHAMPKKWKNLAVQG